MPSAGRDATTSSHEVQGRIAGMMTHRAARGPIDPTLSGVASHLAATMTIGDVAERQQIRGNDVRQGHQTTGGVGTNHDGQMTLAAPTATRSASGGRHRRAQPDHSEHRYALSVAASARLRTSALRATTASGEGGQRTSEGGQVAHLGEDGNHRFAVAIDGPAAAGKSTVGEQVAERLAAIYFDTGILYRALTYAALEQGIDPADEPGLAKLAAALDIAVRRPSVPDGRQSDVLLAGVDVTWELRSGAVDRAVSQVSAHPAVRHELLETQRRIAGKGRVVMVGRDIGTVVLPDADLKIFLIASVEERARRRYQQALGTPKAQELAQIRADLRRRDAIDSSRDVAPLRAADDAIVIDTDLLSIADVVDAVVASACNRLTAESSQ